MRHLKTIFIVAFFCIDSFSLFSQTYDYPYIQDSINLIKGAPDKALPFDKPFYLNINPTAYGFDISQIISVFAHEIKHKNGKRELKNNKADIEFKLGSTYDTAGGKLTLHFPALKPNREFDISIHQSLNANQRFELLSIVKAFSQNDVVAAGVWYNKVKKELTFSNHYIDQRNSFNYADENSFNLKKKALLNPVITDINTTSYQSFSIGSITSIENTFTVADASKIQNETLYLLLPKAIDPNDIARGILPLSTNPGQKAEILDVITRLKNITVSLDALNQIKETLWKLHLRTNNADVKVLQDVTDQNISNLQINQKKLQDLSDKVIKETDDNGDTYQAIWLIGSNKNYNLTTKGGSLLSTQLGITNLTVRNNSNKIENIQKIFTGINIFFRPVDRNLPLKNMRPTSDNDHLSSRENLFQHLTLSVGLTFGDFDQSDANKKDFQNLFGGMSLIAGPSYRFCRAFCLSAGVSVLRRNNPNPLITGTVPTVGFYSSFSIDFDFIATISNITGRILK
jgi:hypothetical protein